MYKNSNLRHLPVLLVFLSKVLYFLTLAVILFLKLIKNCGWVHKLEEFLLADLCFSYKRSAEFSCMQGYLQTWHLVFIGATSSRSLLRVASNQCSGVIFHFLKDSGIILVHLWFDPEMGSTWIFSWPENVAHTRLCSWSSQSWDRLSK